MMEPRDDELRDDLEILEEYLNGVPLPPLEFELVGVVEEAPAVIEPPRTGGDGGEPGDSGPHGTAHPRPITTSTMAEIYVSQGFIQKAIDIYAEILNESPGNQAVIRRIDELSEMLLGEAPPAETTQAAVAAPDDREGTPQPDTERVVETLERWLDNIRRRR